MLSLVLLLLAADPDADVLAEATDLPPLERAAFEKKLRALPKKKRLKLSADDLLNLARTKQGMLRQNRQAAIASIQERMGLDEDAAALWLKKHPRELKILAVLTPEQKQQLKDDEFKVLADKNKDIDDERLTALRALLKRFRGHTGKIQGTDDREEILVGAPPERLAAYGAVSAIGAMKAEDCSCAHVGDRLVLTAGHCFGREFYEKANAPCPSTLVEWGRLSDGKATARSKCVKLVAAEYSEARDFALFRVDTAPPAQLALAVTPRPAAGASVLVLGYPSGKNLSAAPACTLTDGASADLRGHACDTSGGNSGGPVLDAETKKLVAIHNGGHAGNALPDGGFEALNWATVLDLPKLRAFFPDAGQ